MTSTKHTTRLRRNLRWPAIATVALLLVAGCGDSTDQAADVDETASPTTTSAPATTSTAAETTTTTEPPPDTVALEALLADYHSAYNAGQHEAAVALLSGTREVNPLYLEYWVGVLGETVDADCVASTKYPGGMKCIEAYSDDLHGPAGASGQAFLLYFEQDGLLKQLRDPDSYVLPGCRISRCPGGQVRAPGATPEWSYERMEADLFAWMEQSYPEVATAIGDPGRLHYFVYDAEAVSAVLPYVEEFVASSSDWAAPVAAGADLSTMTALEAVEANYEALNSHDPVVFEEFFGEPPSDPYLWFWGQGRKWEFDCVDTDNVDEVRCEGRVVDDFYTKAGALFEYHYLWTKGDDNLFWNTVWENTSDHWAYHDFEEDLGEWMWEMYPDDAAVAYPTPDLVHNGEAAAIAVSHLDEFLEASDLYPRDPDGRNRWSG